MVEKSGSIAFLEEAALYCINSTKEYERAENFLFD